MPKRYIASLLIICQCGYTTGQEDLIRSEFSSDHLNTLALGKSPDNVYSGISLRMDDGPARALQYSLLEYPSIFTVSRYDRTDRYGAHADFVQIKLGGENEADATPIYRLDTSFRDPKIRFPRLFLAGSPGFSAAQRRKVRWLDWDARRGPLPDLSEYPNLETVFSQDAFYGLPLPLKNPQARGIHGLEFVYMGDLHFWSSLYKGRSLSNIHLDFPHYHPAWGAVPSDLYHLDAPTDSLLELPRLRSLRINGLPYFPVCFSHLQKLDYLVLEGLQEPELVTIAAVMHSFGKDTSTGNWKRLLEKADLTAKIVIPETGVFETYYANGSPLCKGTFAAGKPDGTWRFWYENGKLAQERFYRDGKRDGTWVFLVESVFPFGGVALDTFRTLTYSEDRLAERVDFDYGFGYYERFGMDNEHGLAASQITKWSIDDGGPGATVTKKVVAINSDPDELAGRHISVTPLSQSYFGDTIMSSIEVWEWGGTGWSYEFDLSGRGCNDLYARELKGAPGKAAHYGSGHSIHVWWSYYEPGKMTYSEHIQTIDLRGCYWEASTWVKDNIAHPLRLKSSAGGPIGSDEWPCRKQH